MTARKYAPICSFPGCERPHNSRGLCNPHGAMARRGEQLRPIQYRTGPIARPAIDRFAAKVALAGNGCIEWVGGTTLGGYGMFTTERAMAHRWSWEYHVGPIAAGLDIDHLCRNRVCVNPDHLEPVTRAENIRRAAAIITACPAGHAYDADNTIVNARGHRRCRTCATAQGLARQPARNAAKRAERAARGFKPMGPTPKSHCYRGHPLSGDNLYIAPKSKARQCRECKRIIHQQRKAA